MNALAKDGRPSGPLARIAAGARHIRLVTISLATRATSEPGASTLMLVAALAAFGYAAALAGIRIWYEAHGPYNVDTPIYWAIGHGILKGFVPYRDMYETKPPGIFLLSALSYLVTGGGALTHVPPVIVLLFVALAPLAFARRWWAAGTRSALRARRSTSRCGLSCCSSPRTSKIAVPRSRSNRTPSPACSSTCC